MKGEEQQAVYYTVLGAIVVSSLLTGLFFLLLGIFKAGKFIRFIPYPVIGGFMAGTGYLLIRGAFGVMTGLPFNLENLEAYFSSDLASLWFPAFIFAFFLLAAVKQWKHYLIFPSLLLAGGAIFYAILAINGISTEEAALKGWLYSSFSGEQVIKPLNLAALPAVQWSVIFQNSGQIAVLMLLSTFSLLLNITGIEVATETELNFDRELKAAGTANLVGALGSAPVGYQAILGSYLVESLGVRSLLVNLFIGAFFCILLLFGVSAFSYVPKFILAGILMYMGLSFLVEWLWTKRSIFPLVEYLLICLIIFVIAFFGLFEGVLTGLFCAVLLFTFNYSRMDAVKNAFDGSFYHSKIIRPKPHRDLLTEKGFEILILQLQGFIFFGSINKILKIIHSRLSNKAPPKFLIVDCHRVSVFDTSACYSFTQLHQFAEANKITLIWANLSKKVNDELQKFNALNFRSLISFSSLDHALEWCENKILEDEKMPDVKYMHISIERQLEVAFPHPDYFKTLTKYLNKIELSKGEYLAREGDPSDGIYMIESGLIAAQKQLKNQRNIRYYTMSGGTTVGEIGYYLKIRRTADLIALTPATVYWLSEEAFNTMETEAPALSAILHQWIAKLMAERLNETNKTLENLME
ncbi:MAG: cyclic nucleotide-binding domain-containing protein [Parachlamydia sp.]|jgi:SulP family sulfate permease|nr:cyclic nucleotide-binding domain-containing protein [Parachlamydia sp.]